jgi:formamidopyrimidine-DNA glycosylase
MPELPEVETIARDLSTQVLHRRIVAVEKLAWERMVEVPDVATFRALLAGRTIAQIDRRAKWLLLRLDDGWTLTLHLRMSGRISVRDATLAPDEHTHLVLALDDGRRIFFRDPRKFGRARLLDTAGLAALDASFGPEPLGAHFTLAYFRGVLARRSTRIKPLLLDQRIIAGLGNIYVDESLWYARLHPLRPASSLSSAEVQHLYEGVRSRLQAAIGHKGSTLRDYRDGYGAMGANQNFFAVYGRKGEPCPHCGTAVVRIVVAQRGTHLCPACQVLAQPGG